MSTKISIFYEDGVHMYEECLNEDDVYIEVEKPEEASIQIYNNFQSVTSKISAKTFEKMAVKYLKYISKRNVVNGE